MGTKWRGLLAPQNEGTDDGRRFKAFDTRRLPLGLAWQRVDAGGHDGAVVVGSLETINWGTVEEAVGAGWVSTEKADESGMDPDEIGVWGSGEMFDDASATQMPRLAEDVAEAMLLMSKGTIAPSVDPIPKGATWIVEPGSDVPVTPEREDQLWQEAAQRGEMMPQLEVLFELGLIAAATLVKTPAFSEVRPFEFIAIGDTAESVDAVAATERILSLTAAVRAAEAVVPAEAFVAPDMPPAWQYLTVEPQRTGEDFRRVAGYIADFSTCHIGFKNICYTPPATAADYALFHRFAENTDAGLLSVGRITTGHGRVGTSCRHDECRGNDDHACGEMDLPAALAHYDRLREVARVRAHEYDGVGIWVQGVLAAEVTDADLRVLARQKASGDWRDSGGNLELVEVLALAVEQPGFTLPRTSLINGRQKSLTAAANRREPVPTVAAYRLDLAAMGDAVADSLIRRGIVQVPALTAAAADDKAPVHTGAMIALRMTDEDAEALALEGGEAADELHLTLCYLGEAADIPEETQAGIIDAMTALAEQMSMIEGAVFAASLFNPNSDDRETAAVVGIGGAGVEEIHTAVEAALADVYVPVDQHQPFAAHVTLQYTDDQAVIEHLADRTGGSIMFDRLRVAFAGVAHDIPLAGEGDVVDNPDTAASLIAEVESALSGVDADQRDRESRKLLAELEATDV